MGGGPSPAQNRAADSQAALTGQLAGVAGKQEDFFENQQKLAQPFFLNRMNNGLPYFNALTDYSSGANAQAFAPAKNALLQRLSGQPNLPSGYRDQSLADFDANRAHAFDSDLVNNLNENEAAKRFGVGGLTQQQQLANPMGYYSGALQGNSSIMNANLQRPNTLGAIAGGATSGLASFF